LRFSSLRADQLTFNSKERFLVLQGDLEGLGQLKNMIGNRTRDFPDCIILPHLITLLRAAVFTGTPPVPQFKRKVMRGALTT
jgi:hypothetical protein